MTDLVRLPQDPFQRTSTSFHPYETEHAGFGAPRRRPWPKPISGLEDVGR